MKPSDQIEPKCMEQILCWTWVRNHNSGKCHAQNTLKTAVARIRTSMSMDSSCGEYWQNNKTEYDLRCRSLDMHGASSMDDFLFSKRCIGVVIVIALANLKLLLTGLLLQTLLAWQWRASKEYLGQFYKPVKGIRQYQHFSCDSNEQTL